MSKNIQNCNCYNQIKKSIKSDWVMSLLLVLKGFTHSSKNLRKGFKGAERILWISTSVSRCCWHYSKSTNLKWLFGEPEAPKEITKLGGSSMEQESPRHDWETTSIFQLSWFCSICSNRVKNTLPTWPSGKLPFDCQQIAKS